MYQVQKHKNASSKFPPVFLSLPVDEAPPVYGEGPVEWSPDGLRLAYGTKTVSPSVPWDLAGITVSDRNLQNPIELSGDGASIRSFAWSPDGIRLWAVLNTPGPTSTKIRSWNTQSGQVLTDVEMPRGVSRGRAVYATRDSGIYVEAFSKGRTRVYRGLPDGSFEYSHDNFRALRPRATGMLGVVDPQSESARYLSPTQKEVMGFRRVSSFESMRFPVLDEFTLFSRDTMLLGAVYSLETGQFKRYTGPVRGRAQWRHYGHFAWSPFGNLAAVAFNTQHDGRVYVFDPTETPSLEAPMGVQDASIRAIEWVDHQTLATGDASGQVRFWVLMRRA